MPKVPRATLLTVTLGEHHEVMAEADPANRIADSAKDNSTTGHASKNLVRAAFEK